MFAATQQIASVAGLKATKVQVRRVASHRRGDDFDTSILPTAFFLFFKERWSSMMHRRVVSFFFFERDVRRAVRSSGCDDGTKERGALRNDAKVSSRGFTCGRSSERCGVAV